MDEHELDSTKPTAEIPVAPDGADPEVEVRVRSFAEWRGKTVFDRDGERIGKLEDVYFDVETDEPQFGTVKEGVIGRHLTFVPLVNVTVAPDSLQVPFSKAQVKEALNIENEGDELSPADESTLYHHYQLNYTPSDSPSGRRLARR